MALLERAVRRRRRLGLRDRQPLTPLWRLDAERDGAIEGFVRGCPCVVRDLRCELPAAQPDAPAPVLAAARSVGRCAAGRSRGSAHAAAAGRACRVLVLRRRQERTGLAASDPVTLPARARPASRLPPLWHGVELAVPPQAAGRPRNRSGVKTAAGDGAGGATGGAGGGGAAGCWLALSGVASETGEDPSRGSSPIGAGAGGTCSIGAGAADRRPGRSPFGRATGMSGMVDARLAGNPLQEAHALLLTAGTAPCWRAISAR